MVYLQSFINPTKSKETSCACFHKCNFCNLDMEETVRKIKKRLNYRLDKERAYQEMQILCWWQSCDSKTGALSYRSPNIKISLWERKKEYYSFSWRAVWLKKYVFLERKYDLNSKSYFRVLFQYKKNVSLSERNSKI